jgi:hypothetical protein
VRTKLIDEFAAAFKQDFDFLVGPVAPTTAFQDRRQYIDDPLQMYLSDVMTVAASLAGVRGDQPAGWTELDGLPVGPAADGASKSADRELLALGQAGRGAAGMIRLPTPPQKATECSSVHRALASLAEGHCANRKTWPQAIIEADNLLEDALKRAAATRVKIPVNAWLPPSTP